MAYREVRVSRKQVIKNATGDRSTHRQSRSFYLTDEVVERARACTAWAGAGYLTKVQAGANLDTDEIPDSMSELVERGLWSEVLRVEKLLNDGDPFPPAPKRLGTGPGSAASERLRGPRGKGDGGSGS